MGIFAALNSLKLLQLLREGTIGHHRGDIDLNYGREWRAGLICGLVSGAVGGWIFTTIGGWVISAEQKDWWDIASALGTLLAVVAAVSVPMVQTAYTNRRELRRELPHRFSAARSARGATESLKNVLEKWRDKNILKLRFLQATRERLGAISSRIPDANGMEIYLRLTTLTQALIAYAEKREERRKELLQQDVSADLANLMLAVDDEAQASIDAMLDECRKLISLIDLWDGEISEDYRRAKKEPPAVPKEDASKSAS